LNISELWLPPPDLTITEWADNFRRIPPEASSEPGIWKTDRAPYQREMMNAISDDRYERIVMMTAAQIGKTEIILNTLGYYIDKEPSPILLINPTLEMGESFSKDRLAPMIRDTPCLQGKIKDPRTRDSGNTLLHKKFPGGHITIAGSNSPASLASRPIRILLCDEVDRYPFSAGTEGDPLSLAMKRTANFWNRKIVMVSTPTLKGASRIEKAYENSTREEWELPCPYCMTYQALAWANIKYRGLSEPVMRCVHCGRDFPEIEWKKNQALGHWHAHNPSAKDRGFHVNAFASPWVTWKSLCESYDEAEQIGPENVKVWINTVLGVPYEDKSDEVDVHSLEAHRIEYGAELPDDVIVLTCGVDTQDDRFEIEILGWGLNNKTWGIEYKVIYGSPEDNSTWLALEEFLSKTWHYADGSGLGLSITCIDSGGHYTDEVYKFCKTRLRKRIFPIIGRGAYGKPAVSNPSRNNRYRIPLFTLGVSTIKGVLFGRLSVEKHTPGYCYFPADIRGYDDIYFKGLMSERMLIKRDRGQTKITWEAVPHARNEPLDCRVYAMGAFEILNPDMTKYAKRKHLQRDERQSEPEKKSTTATKRKFKILTRGMRL